MNNSANQLTSFLSRRSKRRISVVVILNVSADPLYTLANMDNILAWPLI